MVKVMGLKLRLDNLLAAMLAEVRELGKPAERLRKISCYELLCGKYRDQTEGGVR